MATGGFGGFGDGAVEFFEGLQADNSKAYWSDHEHTYRDAVRTPMLALLAELEPEFGPATLFRPYRDVRFARDKSPYKTQCGAYAGSGSAAFYTHVSADGLLVAGGAYRLAPDQLARYRAAVDDERRGEDLRRRLEEAARRGLERGGDVLRTRPRGVDPDHPRLDLLRHRTLTLSRSWPPDAALHERECLDRVRTGWRAVRPLSEWFADHVGPPEPTA